jgi:hypothetical protein
MNKEQYKTHLRQRLNEEHSDNHDYIMKKNSNDYHYKHRLIDIPFNHKTDAQLALQQQSDAAAYDRQIASHPHGVLTGVLARHLGLDASDVFETTSALTADSPQEHVDRAMAAVIYKHGDRLFNKLSQSRRSPYYTPPSDYHGDGGRYQDNLEKAQDRFVADLTDHINDNVSTGVHTEFKGTPPYDGVE